MARPKPREVVDDLWAVIEPLLPKVERRTRHPGRRRHPDRLVFQGILFVLHTKIAWEHLPQKLGFGSGMTCWRRLAEWTEAGVWSRPHEVLLAELRRGNALDFSRAAVAVPPERGKRGRPRRRRRPDAVLGDRGYDHDKYRRLVRDLGVKPVIVRRDTEHGSGLGAQRWVVERAFAHLHWFRRLRIRWEIRDDIHEAFLTIGCAVICWRRLNASRTSG
ncbi:transposase [Streptomyces sp. NPDC087897]|uniref:transposase n=1 Tax=Streptomyces sp. NPDC087897 TaxID=3365817 RepID=UPI0037FE3052